MKYAVEGLTKTYFGAKQPALRELSFVCHEGINVIYGLRESGKTTLLKIMAGLENAEQGGLYVDNMPIAQLSLKERPIALYIEMDGLFRHKSALKNIAYPLKIRGVKPAQRLAKAREIAEKLQVGEGILLSSGFTLSPPDYAKVQLARTLIREEPTVFLLDNPLRAFSGDERKQMFSLLTALLAEKQGVIVYATDSLEEAEALGIQPVLHLKYGYEISRYPKPQAEEAQADKPDGGGVTWWQS